MSCQRHIKGETIMKSTTLLLGASAVVLSVAAANATELKPFVGIGMGIQGVVYDNVIEDNPDSYAPKDFIAFGIEGGARFGDYNKIYNGGFSVNIDTTDTEKESKKFTNEQVAKIKTTSMTATYDNYIRISGDKAKRIDLVLGAGLGAMNYHYEKDNIDDTIWSTAFAFKTGLDFELTKSLTLSATVRWLLPTREHYGIAASYIAGGAIKYSF